MSSADESVEVVIFETTTFEDLEASRDLFRSASTICVSRLSTLQPPVVHNNIHAFLAAAAQADPDPAIEALFLLNMTVDPTSSPAAPAVDEILGQGTREQKRAAAAAFVVQLHRHGHPAAVLQAYQTLGLELVGSVIRAQDTIDDLLEENYGKELTWEKEKDNFECRIARLQSALGANRTVLVDQIIELEKEVDRKERLLKAYRRRSAALEARLRGDYSDEEMNEDEE